MTAKEFVKHIDTLVGKSEQRFPGEETSADEVSDATSVPDTMTAQVFLEQLREWVRTHRSPEAFDWRFAADMLAGALETPRQL